jgi:hypothetical protein
MKQIKYLLPAALVSLSLFCGPALHAQFQYSCGQNLVPNPGFEDHTSCPNGISELDLAAPWFQPTLGTSDYFNTCATSFSSQVGVPSNFAGSQTPHGGQAYAGAYMYYSGGIVYREYMETPLLVPLVAGHTYAVSFYVSLVSTSEYAVTNVGAYLSVNPVTSANYTNLPVIPQVQNPAGNFLNSANWTLIQGTFTAAGGESYLTIGNFYDDAHTPTQPVVGGNNAGYSYYYIDDVSVIDPSICNTCSNSCLIIVNPGDIAVATCSNSLPVFYSVGVTDNCCTNSTLTISPASGFNFPLGTTTVTSMVTDTCGDTNSCTFTVTVIQNTNAPIIYGCPTNIPVCGTNGCGTMPDVTGEVQAVTAIGVGSVVVTQSIPPGTVLCSNTNVVFTVSDACGDATNCTVPCTLINCASNNCLQIQCWTNMTVISCTNLPVYYYPTATDNCCSNWGILCLPASGSYFEPNTTNTVTCVATDLCGNVSSCSFTVAVNCVTNCLDLVCPSNILVITCSNCAPVNLAAMATDLCCTNNVAISYELNGTSISSPYCFPPGVSTVDVTATDGCSNLATGSFTVVVRACTNAAGPCCGPGLGPQTIHWLPTPASGTVLSDPSGTNPQGSWWVTNLPCYGRVLLTQSFPDRVGWFENTNLDDVPNGQGTFNFTDPGYGPYSWGSSAGINFLATNNDLYTVTFYFLDGPPDPCDLVVAVAGLAQNTTATMSQPLMFQTEYDLNSPLSGGTFSAETKLDGVYGPPIAGSIGTIVSSAVKQTGGDDVNTGWAVLQPLNSLATTNLAAGSVQGFSGPLNNLSYLSLDVNQQPGDGVGFTVGYICCSNCLQVQTPGNIVIDSCTNVPVVYPPLVVTDPCCGTNWNVVYDPPSGSIFDVGTSQTVNFTVVDACGNSNGYTFTVTVNPAFPRVQTPGNIVIDSCTNVEVVYPPLVVNDPCCGTNWSVVYDPPSGTSFAPGTSSLVNWYAYDCLSGTNFFAAYSFLVLVVCTNCCEGSITNYSVTVVKGSNYLADCLCQAPSNTLAQVIPSVPEGTEVYFWDSAAGQFTTPDTFTSGAWQIGTEPLVLGEGFLLVSFTNQYQLTIYGVEPGCGGGCSPLDCFSPTMLAGDYGIDPNPGDFCDRFCCPPPPGTGVQVWNAGTQSFTTYDYAASWPPPPLPVGYSEFVSVNKAACLAGNTVVQIVRSGTSQASSLTMTWSTNGIPNNFWQPQYSTDLVHWLTLPITGALNPPIIINKSSFSLGAPYQFYRLAATNAFQTN